MVLLLMTKDIRMPSFSFQSQAYYSHTPNLYPEPMHHYSQHNSTMKLNLAFAFSVATTCLSTNAVTSASISDTAVADIEAPAASHLRPRTIGPIVDTLLDGESISAATTANENRLLRHAAKKMRKPKAIPATNNNQSPCKDSPLEILLETTGGSAIPFTCKSLKKKHNNAYAWCSQTGVLGSHCPEVCGKCPLYGCSDSQGTFLMEDGCDRDCSWLQGSSARRKEIECEKPSVAKTCRATCNFCSPSPTTFPSAIPSASPSRSLKPTTSPVPSTLPSSIDWQQVHNRLVGDVNGDGFGSAIAMSSDGVRIVVGSEGNASNRGKVTVFYDDGSSWVPIHDCILAGTTGELGLDVGISANGKRFIVGFRNQSTNNGTRSGQVSVYQDDEVSSWVKVNSSISGKADRDRFGGSVGMSDDGLRIVVGADLSDGVAPGTDSGEVAIYQDDQAGSWVLVNTMIPGQAHQDRFGQNAISADGSRVVVGAPYSDGGGYSDTGEVAVYEDNVLNSSWTLVHNKRIPGKFFKNYFGFSVDISSNGSRIVVGAFYHDSNGLTNNGEVTVYQDDGSDWVPVHGSISGLASNDHLGRKVKISADGYRIVVDGALPGNTNADHSGMVRVFDDNMSEWEQVAGALSGEESSDYFGQKLGMDDSGKRIVVAAKSDGSKPGEVRVFER